MIPDGDGACSSDIRNSPSQFHVYCNRTLNLRSIKAIGYDLDYTLIHYRVQAWEETTFEQLTKKLAEAGWPIEGLHFSLHAFQVGLIIDRQLGNIIKADQFGYVKWGSHGTAMLSFEALRNIYSDTIVELPDPRFVFLNTLFSLSESSMYAQMVDRLDAGAFRVPMGYGDLYDRLKDALDETHMEGAVKEKIAADPERFIIRDKDTPRTLLDQRSAGKKLILITNSDWLHAKLVLDYAFSPNLPNGFTWHDLFDIIIVAARKPAFFLGSAAAFEVVSDDGLLRSVIGRPRPGQILYGGHVGLVEDMLGLSGSQILYVGDHAFSDVHVSKKLRRWRTALIVRELEDEIEAQIAFADRQHRLSDLMSRKRILERRLAHSLLAYSHASASTLETSESEILSIQKRLAEIRKDLTVLDDRIRPLVTEFSNLHNLRWGLLMRCGNDKSYFARVVERHADIYTSRVSNLLSETPFALFRAHRGNLPHDVEVSNRQTLAVPDQDS